MIRGFWAASSYGLLVVWMFRPCCPPCQLLAMIKHRKSWQELCDMPALTATHRASLADRGTVSWPLGFPAGQVGLLLQVILS